MQLTRTFVLAIASYFYCILAPDISWSHPFSPTASWHPLGSSDVLSCAGDPAVRLLIFLVMVHLLHACTWRRWVVAVLLGWCCLVVKHLSRWLKAKRSDPSPPCPWPQRGPCRTCRVSQLNEFVNHSPSEAQRAWQIRRPLTASWDWSGFMDTGATSAGITCTTPPGRRSSTSWPESGWFTTPENTPRSFIWDTTMTSSGESFCGIMIRPSFIVKIICIWFTPKHLMLSGRFHPYAYHTVCSRTDRCFWALHEQTRCPDEVSSLLSGYKHQLLNDNKMLVWSIWAEGDFNGIWLLDHLNAAMLSPAKAFSCCAKQSKAIILLKGEVGW